MSVAFTVRAMDAGPVLAQERVAVDDAMQAPELLEDLFRRGTNLLIRHLPSVIDGRAQQQATPQVADPSLIWSVNSSVRLLLYWSPQQLYSMGCLVWMSGSCVSSVASGLVKTYERGKGA